MRFPNFPDHEPLPRRYAMDEYLAIVEEFRQYMPPTPQTDALRKLTSVDVPFRLSENTSKSPWKPSKQK